MAELRMYGGKGKMQIIGRAVEMRVGERFALPISVLAMMSAPAAVIVIREKTKQPEQKSSSCLCLWYSRNYCIWQALSAV